MVLFLTWFAHFATFVLKNRKVCKINWIVGALRAECVNFRINIYQCKKRGELVTTEGFIYKYMNSSITTRVCDTPGNISLLSSSGGRSSSSSSNTIRLSRIREEYEGEHWEEETCDVKLSYDLKFNCCIMQ